MLPTEMLRAIRLNVGEPHTTGLNETRLNAFYKTDENLMQVINLAKEAFAQLSKAQLAMLAKPEVEVLQLLQEGLENFYANDSISPYVPLVAKGPWIVTAYGSVIFDTGGYGMLGFGHNPEMVLRTMAKPYVMANVMTPSFSQQHFVESMRAEIGHTRSDKLRNPYKKFLCLNSGSESICLALRIADVNTKIINDTLERPLPTKTLVVEGAFHGRTTRAAQASHSSHGTYKKYLNSFQNLEHILTVPQNNVGALHEVFARAEKEGFFVETMFLEPVMGEGDPGRAITREFYDAARNLTQQNGTMLVVDSIQAGLRTQGVLSIMDYPGFQDAIPPDMETYSKALNAGNYPLSVLALNEYAASYYRKGIYGNTMTTNPRALEIACTVLENITPAIRKNIRIQGAKLVHELIKLKERSDNMIQDVVGTGLLISVRLNNACCTVSGVMSTEDFVRRFGINVIHGGQNSLRLTPYFYINDQEIDLIVSVMEEALGIACKATATCCRKGSQYQSEYIQYR